MLGISFAALPESQSNDATHPAIVTEQRVRDVISDLHAGKVRSGSVVDLAEAVTRAKANAAVGRVVR